MKKIIHFLCALLMMVSVLSIAKVQTVTVQAEDTVTMYRLYNPYSGEHFYTSSTSESSYLVTLGWRDEGVGWVAPAVSNTPVYRMYNPYSGDHHYTPSMAERDWLIPIGWRYEGIGWYSDDSQRVPLYRQFNPNEQVGTHNYTTSQAENDKLVSIGWRAEGIGWYAVSASTVPNTATTAVQPVVPPFYSQLDPQWANIQVGGYSMGSTACGCCTMAMIISARTGRAVLPTEVATNLHNAGLYNNPGVYGTNGASFVTAGRQYNLSCDYLDSYDRFVNCLAQGKLVAMQVVGEPFVNPGASHAMVIYGYSNGTVNVLDPLGGKCNGQYAASDIWAHQTTVPTDLDQGVPGFAF
jgi:hypothetical protein